MERDQIKVVLVDDLAATRRALKALLAFENRISIVGEASNGKEAVGLVDELKPDLVLMDVQMPVMDGLKATQEIKSTRPEVIVVIYTIFPSYQEEAYHSGADYFLIKGCSGITPTQIILSFFPVRDTINPK